LQKKRIKAFEFYVSLDSVGEQAEYIRSGLNYNLFIKNLIFCCNHLMPEKIIIMCTFNILSVPRFGDFLRMIADLKQKFCNLLLDISFLHNPKYLSAT
jgi:hypothetical protein